MSAGQYNAHVAYGQKRILVVFTRLTRPDGISISLSKFGGVDLRGRAGLEGGVDNHWSKLFAAAALSALFGAGASNFTDHKIFTDTYYDHTLKKRVMLGAFNGIAQAGQQTLDRTLDIQPTLTIRAGLQFNIFFAFFSCFCKFIVYRDRAEGDSDPRYRVSTSD